MRNLIGYANIRVAPRRLSKKDSCLAVRLNGTSQPHASLRMAKLYDLERAAYNDPTTGAASGIQFAKLLDRLGIAKEMKTKTVLATSAADMTSIVANGKADFVVHQRGILLTVPGIDIVGPLPSNLYQPIVFTAIVMNSTKDAGIAKVLVKFLRGPESAKVIKSKGMDPE